MGIYLGARVARFEVDDMVNLPVLTTSNLAKGLMGFQLPSEFQSLCSIFSFHLSHFGGSRGLSRFDLLFIFLMTMLFLLAIWRTSFEEGLLMSLSPRFSGSLYLFF